MSNYMPDTDMRDQYVIMLGPMLNVSVDDDTDERRLLRMFVWSLLSVFGPSLDLTGYTNASGERRMGIQIKTGWLRRNRHFGIGRHQGQLIVNAFTTGDYFPGTWYFGIDPSDRRFGANVNGEPYTGDDGPEGADLMTRVLGAVIDPHRY